MRGEKCRIGRLRFLLVAAFSVASICFSPSTGHADDEYFEDLGWYAGLGGSLGLPLGGSLGEVTENTGGFSLTAGYRIYPQIALEGEFEWLAGFTNSTGYGIDYPILMTVNAKSFAFTGRTQPWMLFGMGTMTLFDNTTPTEVLRLGYILRFGAGFDYHVNSKLALTTGVHFVVPTGRIDSYTFLTFKFGSTYRF